MGLGNTVKAIWSLLSVTTSPDVVALYNNLWQQLEGAKMGAINGKGSIFFVNGGADGVTAGIDTNDGLTPANAFLTIAHALTLVTNDNDDFIYCFNVYNQDTFPIALDNTMDSVHIIGIAGPNGAWPMLDASAGNTAVFTVANENCEIAGFNLAGGAAHGAIEIGSGANMAWIHNCTFGHYWSGACQDGITGGGSVFSVIIEDCWFFGTDAKNGTLTRCGILSGVGASWGQWTIRNNFFNGLPTGAIDLGVTLDSTAIHDFVIEHNIIGCEDTDNIAINLGAVCHYAIVSDNKAQNGKAVMGNNPYGDAATDNHWMCNQEGIVMVYPDT